MKGGSEHATAAVKRSCGRTGTPPVTAWCRCRSPCRCRDDKRAEGAALQLAGKMGMDPAMVVHAKPMGDGFTFFVVYGRVQPPGRPVAGASWPSGTSRCCRPRRSTRWSSSGCGASCRWSGACIGTDAHTVGIDAILNVKGIAGEKGLEYYRELRVVNMGAQVQRAGAGRAGPRPSGPTRCWSARWSPSATRTCTTPGRCRRRSGRRAGRAAAAAGRRRAAVRRD